MRVDIFTPEMLSRHNYGLYIIKSNVEDVTENTSYARTVSFKLGYINTPLKENNLRYGIINFLTDGWFYPVARTDDEMCEYLNNNPHGSKFRLLTKKEVIYMLKSSDQGFL